MVGLWFFTLRVTLIYLLAHSYGHRKVAWLTDQRRYLSGMNPKKIKEFILWEIFLFRHSPDIVHHIFDARLRKEIHLALSIIEETRTDTNSSCGAPGIHQHIHKNEKIAQFGGILSLSCLLGFVQNSPRLLCQRKEEFWLGHIFVAILLETANSFVFLSKTVCSVCNNKFPG